MFFCCSFAYVFDSLCGIALPTTARKILFLSGSLFGRNFRERTLVFLAFVAGWCFFVVFPMFLLYYVALCSRKLSASNLVLSDAHVGRNFRERTFGFEPLCPVGVFVVVFPMFLLHYVALFSRKLSE